MVKSFKNYLMEHSQNQIDNILNEATFKYNEVKYIPLLFKDIEDGKKIKLGPKGQGITFGSGKDKHKSPKEVKIKWTPELKRILKASKEGKVKSLRDVPFVADNGVTYQFNHIFKGAYSGHSRKDSTAASNVNEVFSLYYLLHNFVSPMDTINELSEGGTKTTGIFTGEGKPIKYNELLDIVLQDVSYEDDLKIGANNAHVLKQDIQSLKSSLGSIKKMYWTPRAKPNGVSEKHPADIMIEFNKGMMGYSNKAIRGKVDLTPKLNTNLVTAYKNFVKGSQKAIEDLVDDSWNQTVKNLPSHLQQFFDFDIKKEKYGETSSSSLFAEIEERMKGTEYNFSSVKGSSKPNFYHMYRNNLIRNYVAFLNNEKNLKDLLKIIGMYTYGNDNNEVPYKLLIGSTSGSTIKDVSNDLTLKNVLFNPDIKDYSIEYDGESQQFEIYAVVNDLNIYIPFTMRTRVGGLKGKSLYITTSGVKIK